MLGIEAEASTEEPTWLGIEFTSLNTESKHALESSRLSDVSRRLAVDLSKILDNPYLRSTESTLLCSQDVMVISPAGNSELCKTHPGADEYGMMTALSVGASDAMFESAMSTSASV